MSAIAQKAENYLVGTGTGDTALFRSQAGALHDLPLKQTSVSASGTSASGPGADRPGIQFPWSVRSTTTFSISPVKTVWRLIIECYGLAAVLPDAEGIDPKAWRHSCVDLTLGDLLAIDLNRDLGPLTVGATRITQ